MNYLAQQGLTNPAIGQLGTLNGVAYTQNLIRGVIAAIMVLAGVVFVFMIITNGVKYISAGGDKSKVEGAQKGVTNALIGLIIVFSLYAIASLVGCFFNLNFFAFEIGPFNATFAPCR